ncbi:tail terminator [Mycobacterium phage FlagStaff]|uniref:Tail terminator n=1 Tax=Mycobacterium phage FlagStaff TaxID=1647304 RepID=A0A0F6YRT9_9CAUD|nr:tail terminator [Mycobacterium phage FlagStaff]AKF14449.1 tail terminator [Mycobacterium phage FlagStaff]
MTGPAAVGDMPATMTGPTMEPAFACRAYLTRRLADRGITEQDLPVGSTEPMGTPRRYVLLNQVDSRRRGPLADYMLRARVFDEDVEKCGRHTTLLHAALLGAAQVRVVFPDVGELWVTGTEHVSGPSDIDDEEAGLFGQAVTVFWTVALKPI